MAPKGTKLVIGLDGSASFQKEQASRMASGVASRMEGHVTEYGTGLEHSYRPASQGSNAVVWNFPDGSQQVISQEEAKKRAEGLRRRMMMGEGESRG